MISVAGSKQMYNEFSFYPKDPFPSAPEEIALLLKEEEPTEDAASITSRLSLVVDETHFLQPSSVSFASDTASSDEIIFADFTGRAGDPLSASLFGLDAQRYDPNRRWSRTSSIQSSSDLEAMSKKPAAVEEVEIARADPMDPQRYDLSIRCLSPSCDPAFLLPKQCPRCSIPINGDKELCSTCDVFTESEVSSYTSLSKASIEDESLRNKDSQPWVASLPGANVHITDQWQTGDTITTRVILRPGPSNLLRSPLLRAVSPIPRSKTPKSPNLLHSPLLRAVSPTPRSRSPKSPKQAFRALNCMGKDDTFEEQVIQALDQREQERQGGGMTIFVHEQRRCYSLGEEEREQMWRDAKCNVCFGGDREAFEKAFPPGCPRWS